MTRNLAVLAIALSLGSAARAEVQPALPDVATITVPDVSPSSDPKVREDGYKFYYFHSPEVTFAEAYQDLAECRRYLVPGVASAVPGFNPWDDQYRKPRPVTSGLNPYGLVGVGISAIIAPKMERGARSNKMRRCMGPRGYARYAIPEATFDKLNEGEEQQLLLMQAKLASGPRPQDQEVTR